VSIAAAPSSAPGGEGASQAPAIGSARAWTALVLLSLLYIISFVDRLVLALLVEPIKADLGISDVQIGLLIGTSFAIVYALTGLPLARIADTSSRRMLIFGGALLWGLSTFAAAFANSFTVLVALRIGVAVGEAALVPAAMSILSDLFPANKRALPISIFVMVGVCGGSGSMLIGGAVLDFAATSGALPLVGDMSAWRLTLILVGAPAVLLALLALFILPAMPAAGASGSASASIGELKRYYSAHPRTYIGFYTVTALVSAINFSILTWFPTHLIRSYGLAAPDAGYLFGTVGVATSLVGGLLLPWIARRMVAKGRFDSTLTIALFVCCLSSPLLIASLLAPSPELAILIAAIPFTLQFGLGILLAATAPLLAPPQIRAQLVAIFFLFLSLIGLGIGPALVAWLAQNVGWLKGSVPAALALIILIFAPAQIVAILRNRGAFAKSYEDAA
jgi:predicted MFS family arabinose efflux permease